jgi:hypothetical protein
MLSALQIFATSAYPMRPRSSNRRERGRVYDVKRQPPIRKADRCVAKAFNAKTRQKSDRVNEVSSTLEIPQNRRSLRMGDIPINGLISAHCGFSNEQQIVMNDRGVYGASTRQHPTTNRFLQLSRYADCPLTFEHSVRTRIRTVGSDRMKTTICQRISLQN